MTFISGIYKITNKVNNKFYIGSSVNIHKRWISHKCQLRKQKHPNAHLQHSFNLYGIESLSHEIIEYCEPCKLREREQFYLDSLYSKSNCYNIFKEFYAVNGKNHPMYGKTHSLESRLKIKEARKRQKVKHSIETKNKISKGNKGKKMPPGHLDVMLKSRKGLEVWNKGLKTGIEPINKIKLDNRLVISLYLSGISMEEIRKKLSVSWDVVKRVLIENEIKTRNISEQKAKYHERKNRRNQKIH